MNLRTVVVVAVLAMLVMPTAGRSLGMNHMIVYTCNVDGSYTCGGNCNGQFCCEM